MSQQNFLILFSDQLRADALGCYGNEFTQTPALDDIAARGTKFTSAYTPSPVCVPARSSLITGLEPQNGNCFENEGDTSPARTFMDVLATAGYESHGIGKMHFTPGKNDLRGFASREVGEEFGSQEDDDYLAFLATRGYDYVEKPHGLRDEMYYVPQLSPVPEELHHSHWVADRSVDFLSNRTTERPFLLWSSFIAPHPPFAPPSPWHRMFEPSTMLDPFEPEGGDELLTIYNELQNRYKYRDGGRDRRLWQLIRAYYYASVSYMDSQIARIMQALDASGHRDNTTVIVAADHAEFLGDYGCFGKRSFLDAAARIPMIISGPGFEHGKADPTPVSLIDVFPTIARAADVAHPEVDGDALQELPVGRPVFGQYQQGEAGLYTVITDDWKYIYSAFDAREYLIDRRRDPRETMNVAYNVRRRHELEAHRTLCREHFTDLANIDFDAQTDNAPLTLGAAPTAESLRALRATRSARDASTLVVQGGAWSADLAVD